MPNKDKLKKYRVFFRGSYDRENATSVLVEAPTKKDAEEQIKRSANYDSAYVGVCWAELEEEE